MVAHSGGKEMVEKLKGKVEKMAHGERENKKDSKPNAMKKAERATRKGFRY